MIDDALIRKRAAEVAAATGLPMTVQPYALVQSTLDGGAYVDVTLRLSAEQLTKEPE